jgi:hypothetical protein
MGSRNATASAATPVHECNGAFHSTSVASIISDGHFRKRKKKKKKKKKKKNKNRRGKEEEEERKGGRKVARRTRSRESKEMSNVLDAVLVKDGKAAVGTHVPCLVVARS